MAAVSASAAAAREEVGKCEKEIHAIKAALRSVAGGGTGSSDKEPTNSMEVVLLKVRTIFFLAAKR